jgi:hypothetical protein
MASLIAGAPKLRSITGGIGSRKRRPKASTELLGGGDDTFMQRGPATASGPIQQKPYNYSSFFADITKVKSFQSETLEGGSQQIALGSAAADLNVRKRRTMGM